MICEVMFDKGETRTRNAPTTSIKHHTDHLIEIVSFCSCWGFCPHYALDQETSSSLE